MLIPALAQRREIRKMQKKLFLLPYKLCVGEGWIN